MQTNSKEIPYKSIAIFITMLLAAAVVNFNSLWLHLGDHLPGSPEQAALGLLHTWWPLFSLTTPDGLAIHSFIGAPYLSNHLLYMPILQSVIFSALQIVLSPIAAFNLVLIVNQIGTQVALFALLRRQAIPALWAGLGATAFILSPWYHTQVAEANVIATGVWIVLAGLLAWEGWRMQPSYGRSLLVVVALYGAVLGGLQNIMWLALIWLPYAIWQRDRPDPKTARESGMLIGLGFMVLCLLYPVPDLVRSLQGNEPAYGPAFGEPILRSFIGWALRTGPGIGLMTGLTLLLRAATRQNVVWLIMAGASLLMGFGLLPDPLQMVTGALSLPYWPLAEREFFFGPALLAALLYLALAWQQSWLEGRRTIYWRFAAVGVGALILVTNPALLRPLPSQAAIISPFYQEIAAEPEDYLLLEYPYGLVSIRDGQTLGEAAYLARNAVWDHKREISGVAPFYDAHTLQQIRATSFLFPESIPEADRPEAAEALGRVVREGRIGYIVIHPELLSDLAQAAIVTLIKDSQALCPPITREGLIIYRALWHPKDCYSQ